MMGHAPRLTHAKMEKVAELDFKKLHYIVAEIAIASLRFSLGAC